MILIRNTAQTPTHRYSRVFKVAGTARGTLPPLVTVTTIPADALSVELLHGIRPAVVIMYSFGHVVEALSVVMMLITFIVETRTPP